MLSSPHIRIFLLITFNFNHYALIQNHALFSNTLPWYFKLFLREKIIILDLCEDMMNYFHEGSFIKNNKVLLLEIREQSVQMKKEMTYAYSNPNELFLWFKTCLAYFCLFSFSFSCFYAFPAGLTLAGEIFTRKRVLIFPIWFQPLWERLG